MVALQSLKPFDQLVLLVLRDARPSSFDPLPAGIREGIRRTTRLARRLETTEVASKRSKTTLDGLFAAWEYCERLCDATPALHPILNRDLARWAGALRRAHAAARKVA
jgi:hypothetical protein